MSVVKVPSIPDPEALEHVRKLCEIPTPYDSCAEADALFVQAMREITDWHGQKSGFYGNLLAQKKFQSSQLKTIEDCARIPAIPANFFKNHEIASLPKEKISITLTSSGTTGQKSQMSFDEWSIKAPQRMVEFQFDSNGWSTPQTKVNYLLSTYEVEPDSRLGTAFTDNFLCGFAPANRVDFLLKRTGLGGHEFDIFGAIETLREYAAEGIPVRIFGFPAFVYFILKRMRELKLPPLRLSKESLVFFGGGWKGNADKAIAPQDLYQMIVEGLGIPEERIRDGYGSVEHCIPYVECRKHHFHVPVWSRVFIRDVKTLEPLPHEKPGFIHFVSPYITSVPAHSVLMGDLAQIFAADACGCGISTPWFQILGRAGTSKNKSCAITAAELLRGIS